MNKVRSIWLNQIYAELNIFTKAQQHVSHCLNVAMCWMM